MDLSVSLRYISTLVGQEQDETTGVLAYGFLAKYKNCYISVSQPIKQLPYLLHISLNLYHSCYFHQFYLSLNVCKNVNLTTVELLLFGTKPFSTQQLHYPCLLA